MKPDELLPARTISIRLPAPLATALRRVALRESNRDSVVARRLLATALRADELRPNSGHDDEGGGAA